MIPGAPHQARWMRAEPRRSLPAPVLERIARTAFPGCRVLSSEPLGDGKRNANFKLHLDPAPAPVVLRIYEHDPTLCQKEIDLMRLVSAAVPVPEVIYAEPHGWEDLPPFTFTRWIEGITFKELKRSGDADAIPQAAQAAGEILATIGSFRFPKPGWLAPGPTVGAPLVEGADPTPRFIDLCLAAENLQRRMAAELCDRTHALVWSWAPRLAALDAETSLVHGDFNKRNLLLRPAGGRWRVAAVLDWEFAVSSSPLADLGSFLRYERAARPLAEPHFSVGYMHAGGRLPHDWRRLAQLLNLVALCESLTHDELQDDVVAELVELVRATIEDRDPE
ncbi:MAG: aminoglycoside phosphotransferase family protein [Bryobacteraceae bacterium]